MCGCAPQGFDLDELPFAPKLTFALSVGNLVPVLQQAIGLHVFDDQERFCWPGGAGTPGTRPQGWY